MHGPFDKSRESYDRNIYRGWSIEFLPCPPFLRLR